MSGGPRAGADQPNRWTILGDLGPGDEIAGLDVDYTKGDFYIFVPIAVVAFVLYNATQMLVSAVVPPIWRATVLEASAATGWEFPFFNVLPALPGLFGLLACAACLLGGLLLVDMTPDDIYPHEWLRDMFRFRRQTKTMSALAEDSDSSTDSIAKLSQFRPEADAAERVDGAMLGAVRVDAAALTLASNDERIDAVDELGGAFNGFDFPFQIHSTTRRVDPERLTKPYERRKHDPDVRDTPALAKVVEAYARELPTEFRERGTSTHEHAIIVPVRPAEVQVNDKLADTWLTSLPLAGGVIETYLAAQSGLDDDQLRHEQLDELDKRLDTVASAVGDVSDCETERLSGADLATIIEEYWLGDRTHYSDGAEGGRPRSVPIVRGVDTDENSA